MIQNKQTILDTYHLIKADLQFRSDYEHKKLTFIRALIFLLNHSVFSQVLFRLQVLFFDYRLTWVAALIKAINAFLFTVSIDSTARIQGGLLILHANNIRIGRFVTIGKKCILTHQNIIEPSSILELNPDSDSDSADVSSYNKGPNLGDEVLLGVGSVITGNITIGNGTKIMVNSSVDKSFPNMSVLVGVPARNLKLTR